MNRILCLLLLNTVTAPATTFYCDPQRGGPDGDGSADHPWGAIEQVLAARRIQLRDPNGHPTNPDAPVQPGDTILLRSGWHGVLRIDRAYNDRFITLAAEKDQKPQVAWIEIGEGRKWRLRGLTVSPSLAPAPLERVPHSLVMLGERGGEESSELVVEDCFVFSTLDPSMWTGRDWVTKPANGIWLGRHGRAHVARNNYVLNTRFGIQLCAPDCLAEGNVVANFSADGIRVMRDAQTVQYNIIKNIFVGARDGDDNHDDGIQAFLFNVGTGTLRDVTLRGNIIMARETDDLPYPNGLQGIGCFDGPLVRFTVENNVVAVNHYHGISLYDAQDCTLLNNACFSRWPDRAQPWIMLGQKKNQAAGNTVRNNLAHSFNFKADAQVAADHNQQVTEPVFRQKLAALAESIDRQFGPIHPVAARPRLASPPTPPDPLPSAPNPTAPPPSSAKVDRQPVKVIVINFDPVLKTRNHLKLHEYMKWSDPWQLTEKMVEDARLASAGYVDYRIAEKIEYDGFTTFRNGFTYTEEAFLKMWETDRASANPGMTSFQWLFEKFDLAAKIKTHDAREIWLWGAPYMAWDELHWKIPGDRIPYPTDNPWFYRPYDIPEVDRTIWIMGWNYERGEGEMLESYCHRIESVLSLTVGRGIWDHQRNPDNVWNRFTRVDKDFPGQAEVGSVHYAPNSQSDYDWSNPNPVWTYADDWLSYPELPRRKKQLNAVTGGWNGIVEHHLWWMTHLPHAPGTTDGFHNNWWQYIVNYDEAIRTLPPPGATFLKAQHAMYAN